MSHAYYGELAELLDFPGPHVAARGGALLDFLRESHREAAAEVGRFLDAMPPGTVDLQELHTRTFEVQALTTLNVGYVLFGDDYKRGALLSGLNQEHGRARNDCRGELADYLPNLLRLLPKLDDGQLQGELVGQILVPALRLMIREFDPERIDRKNTHYRKHFKALIEPARGSDATLYRHLLRATMHLLEQDFGVTGTTGGSAEWITHPQSADFLQLVEREMDAGRDDSPAGCGCDA